MITIFTYYTTKLVSTNTATTSTKRTLILTNTPQTHTQMISIFTNNTTKLVSTNTATTSTNRTLILTNTPQTHTQMITIFTNHATKHLSTNTKATSIKSTLVLTNYQIKIILTTSTIVSMSFSLTTITIQTTSIMPKSTIISKYTTILLYHDVKITSKNTSMNLINTIEPTFSKTATNILSTDNTSTTTKSLPILTDYTKLINLTSTRTKVSTLYSLILSNNASMNLINTIEPTFSKSSANKLAIDITSTTNKSSTILSAYSKLINLATTIIEPIFKENFTKLPSILIKNEINTTELNQTNLLLNK